MNVIVYFECIEIQLTIYHILIIEKVIIIFIT
jgi:hypothetical protein